MSRYSLRRRLLLWLFLATGLLGLAALTDTWFDAQRTAQGVSDRVLAGSALAIAERVRPDASGALAVDIPYSALEMLTSTAQDQVFYRVDGPEGFLTGYETLAPVPAATPSTNFSDGEIGGVPVRIATLKREISTGQTSIGFSVTVAESTLARTELARAILLRSAVRLLVLACVAALIVWISVTLALRPLNRFGEAIALRSPDDLRPVRGDMPEEVEGLVDAINSFMQRLDQALNALRNFTGNASHQLRTPLATVRAQLAMAMRSGDPVEQKGAAEKAESALVRAERVLAQLLVLARVDAATRDATRRQTDIAALARAMTAEMVPIAARRSVDLGYEGPVSAMALAEPVLFQELLQNLIDNAVRYSGAGARVTVRIAADAQACLMEVEDNGPGLPSGQIEAFANRSPERRHAPGTPGQHSGLGLGLAIVREIAGLMNASIEIARPDAGSGTIIRIGFDCRPV